MNDNYVSDSDLRLHRHVNERLLGLRVNRYSWWVHARELADFILPRRYKWLITPNQMTRGSPINQHILDSTGTLAARNLASGMMSGISSPTRPWLKLKIGHIDSTQTSPTSLWLSECERLMMLVFQESNFYNSIAIVYFDLVVFGTAVMLVYEDFDNVIHCYNPCFGEFYLDMDGRYRPVIFFREFTMTVDQVVNQFGLENTSTQVKSLYKEGKASLTREIIVAHAIEPNDDGRQFGIPEHFKFRECYWEWGGSTSPQGGVSYAPGFLRKRGFFENPCVAVRWDLVSNDAYGRSPGMDALPDIKQLQQQVRRKGQAIDKTVNPPMVADVQLKNQPASLLPGGTTYVAGMMQANNAGFAPVYGNWKPGIAEISEDLNEVRERIKRIFYNDLFQVISQFQTRSNVSATEIDARRSEALIMLGPVLERIEHELLQVAIDRTFAVMSRSGVLPPPPADIQGRNIDIEYISMLSQAQQAAASSGIERTLQLVGGLVGVDPSVMDNLDLDATIEIYSNLMNNNPRMIRSPQQLQQIRKQRAQAQAQAQQAQQVEQAEKLAAGAKNLSDTDLGGGKNALQMMTGAA